MNRGRFSAKKINPEIENSSGLWLRQEGTYQKGWICQPCQEKRIANIHTKTRLSKPFHQFHSENCQENMMKNIILINRKHIGVFVVFKKVLNLRYVLLYRRHRNHSKRL